jgi:hypothetical protein
MIRNAIVFLKRSEDGRGERSGRRAEGETGRRTDDRVDVVAQMRRRVHRSVRSGGRAADATCAEDASVPVSTRSNNAGADPCAHPCE